MVIAATVIWIVGFLFFLIFGGVLIADSEIHREEPFQQYYESWGAVRFYTMVVFAFLALVSIWPIALVTLWIVALIKKW